MYFASGLLSKSGREGYHKPYNFAVWVYMFSLRRLILCVPLALVFLAACDAKSGGGDIDFDAIKDEALRECVIIWAQGRYYASEIEGIACPMFGISSLEGLKQFSNLRTLSLRGNRLHSIDLSVFPNLQYLDLSLNRFESIDLTTVPELLEVKLSENSALHSVDFSNNKKLESILIYETDIASLELSENTNLEELIAYDCKFSGDVRNGALDLSKNKKLINLNLFGNKITHIDVSKNTNLDFLSLAHNELVEIDLKTNTNLTDLRLNKNQLTALNVIYLKILDRLIASDNQISDITLPLNKKLRFAELANNLIDCGDNSCNGESTFQIPTNSQFIRLDLSHNLLESDDIVLASHLGFTELILSGNSGISGVFNLSQMTGIVEVRLDDTNISGINFASQTSAMDVFNVFEFLQVLTARGDTNLDQATIDLITEMNNQKGNHPNYEASVLCYASQPTDTCGDDI